jgi:hypothetical protein
VKLFVKEIIIIFDKININNNNNNKQIMSHQHLQKKTRWRRFVIPMSTNHILNLSKQLQLTKSESKSAAYLAHFSSVGSFFSIVWLFFL